MPDLIYGLIGCLCLNFIIHAIHEELDLALELVQLHLNFLELLAGFQRFLFFFAQLSLKIALLAHKLVILFLISLYKQIPLLQLSLQAHLLSGSQFVAY